METQFNDDEDKTWMNILYSCIDFLVLATMKSVSQCFNQWSKLSGKVQRTISNELRTWSIIWDVSSTLYNIITRVAVWKAVLKNRTILLDLNVRIDVTTSNKDVIRHSNDVPNRSLKQWIKEDVTMTQSKTWTEFILFSKMVFSINNFIADFCCFFSFPYNYNAVSYTHLTLPTICSV